MKHIAPLLTLVLALLIAAAPPLHALPAIDNNAGTWTDSYNDAAGVVATTNTEVNAPSGTVRLVTGQNTGTYSTSIIKPNSFSAWGELTLNANYSAVGDIQVEILDPLNGDALISGPANYTGPIDLSAINPVTYPDLRFRLTLTAGSTRPTVSALTTSWTPKSGLLITKQAPAEVQAGQPITYRINYSTAYVNATDVVVYDTLSAMTYPADYGQDDNLTFVSATNGGLFTATPITVKGVSIPANSVYWDLGTVPAGTSQVLFFTMRSKNGTLDGSIQANSAAVAASNADPASSAPVQTTIRSTAKASIKKSAIAGVYALEDGNFTESGATNRFEITIGNSNNETLYQTVLFDNLDNLTGKINPDFGGTDIPVASLSPAGGIYTPTAITVDGTAVPANSVYWQVGTLAPGASFTARFSVELLNEPALVVPGEYTNTATVDSIRTTPAQASLTVKYSLDEASAPGGVFAKGDNISGSFRVSPNFDDNKKQNDRAAAGPNNPFLYVRPGEPASFALSATNNNGLVALNDVVILDKIPAGTTFKSAWFSDPALQSQARIFYSTIDTANADTPHPYDVSEAPGDLDPTGESNWENYATNPPANPADVKWIAYWIPAINSSLLNSSAAGWVPGAPTSAVGYFDVTISSSFLDPNPCADKFVNNRGLFRIHASTPLAGGAPVALPAPLESSDDEPVLVSTDKPLLGFSSRSTVSPPALDNPGPLAFTATVKNGGQAIAENVKLTFTWPQVNINGTPQYLTVSGVNRPIESFDPVNGTLTVSLGNLAPGASLAATLTVNVPGGIAFNQQLAFTARTSAAASPCEVTQSTTTASANARFLPALRMVKNDIVDLITPGGFIDYSLTARNTGNAPSSNTWIVDRVPAETTFVSANGPQGQEVWFATADSLPPAFLTPLQPIDSSIIVSNFTPGVRDDNGTPGDPSDDTWTSPFGTSTRWIAWRMDDLSLSPAIFPVGAIDTVGFRVQDNGSTLGTQIYNSAGIFSNELIQSISNEVVTSVVESPGVLVSKTGPNFVTSGQPFNWTISYFNNSTEANDTTVVTDTLPAGVTFGSATHTWNATAIAGGAPSNNNGQLVPTSATTNPDGTTTLVFNIAGPTGYRGNNVQLGSLEGGTLTITATPDPILPSGTALRNQVEGTAENSSGVTVSRDQHETEVRKPDLRVGKLGQPNLPVSGDTVTYTVAISNDGFVPAADVVITDTLPTGMTYVPGSTQVLSAGYTLGEPVVSGQTLTWSLAGGNPITGPAPLAPGALAARSGDILIQYQTTVDLAVPAGTNLPNTVNVTTTSPEDDTTNNTDDEEVRNPFPDPAVLKTGPTFVNPGDRFFYTLSYFNTTRQPATNVYLIDTLPDYTTDGEADLTFISQSAPAGVTAYYSTAPTTAVPAFNPLDPTGSGDWTASPTGVTNHIAWLVGALPGEAGPFNITVTVDAISPSGGILPAGVEFTNSVTISTPDTDEDPANSQDDHTTRTPGNDIALVKTATTEGAFPGLAPGDAITYTLEVSNTGTENTYGIEVVDTLPAGLSLASPSPGPAILALVDANGNPVQPVDENGDPIEGDVPITVTTSGSTVTFQLGGAAYRSTGLRPGQRQFLQIHATVNLDVANGTPLDNTATATLKNREDTDPPETFLGNNTDTSGTVVYLPDLAVRKSVRDLTTGSEDFTEAGRLLEYTLEYTNLGAAPARDVVLSEIVPLGTTLRSVANPPGSSITYSQDLEGRINGFDVSLGTLAPLNVTGVFQSSTCLAATSAVALRNGLNGVHADTFSWPGQAGSAIREIGDVDGNGISDIVIGAPNDREFDINNGAAYVVLLEAGGVAKSVVKLVNGQNGIPANAFLVGNQVGQDVDALGDVDGDGVPDLLLSYEGGAWVILLNPDGTAKSAVQLASGINGIPAGTFTSSLYENDLAAVGDIDGNGVTDFVVNNNGNATLVLLNNTGAAEAVVTLATGITAGSVTALGDINGDGVPDVALGDPVNEIGGDEGGGLRIVLLNADGTPNTVVPLYNGQNGIDPGTFINNEDVGYLFTVEMIGDVDGDGVPDLAAGVPQKSNPITFGYDGGAYVILLNADGTAKAVVDLSNGRNGIPDGGFFADSSSGESVAGAGDVDGDGVPDLLISATYGSYFHVALLNRDGTAKALLTLEDGSNGIPSDTLLSGDRVASIGDVNGDGRRDILVGDFTYDGNIGQAVIFTLGDVPCDASSLPVSNITGTNVSAGQLVFEILPGNATSIVEFTNDSGGLPPASLLSGDGFGSSVAPIGDVDGDGVIDVVIGAPTNDDGSASNSGGAWVLLLNPDGTIKSATEFANGKNGIPGLPGDPVNSFLADDRVGTSVAGIGDVDGNGVPDILLGSSGNDDGPASSSGGAWVILLEYDSVTEQVQALSAIELANDSGGIPAGSFLTQDFVGLDVAALGKFEDNAGIEATYIVLGAVGNDDGSASGSGGAWVIRLDATGNAVSAIELANGKNGIPGLPGDPDNSFLASDAVGRAVATIGDVDGNGVPDILLGATGNDDGAGSSGAAWVILLEFNGSNQIQAKSAIELANGKNGIPGIPNGDPANSFLNSDSFGDSVAGIGDVDADGVPDILVGATGIEDPSTLDTIGGAWVILLNSDGTAKSAIKLTNGINGIPNNLFPGSGDAGAEVSAVGDLDRDGVPDVTIQIPQRLYDEFENEMGGTVVVLLNPDGTAKRATLLTNGMNGVPAGTFDDSGWPFPIASLGDLNGDGQIEILLGNGGQESQGVSTGGTFILSLSDGLLATTGSAEVPLTADAGLESWDTLFSVAEVPDGTTLSYTIGRWVDGAAIYDLGPSWTNIQGPLPQAGLDLSGLTPPALVVRLDYTTTLPTNSDGWVSPVVESVFANYQSSNWPSITFTVSVDSPVAANVLPDINNTVTITTSTPETDDSNNQASDDINVLTTDLEVVKTVDQSAALAGDTVNYTLTYHNNGPQDAPNVVLTDTLPPGFIYDPATAPAFPVEPTSISGFGTPADPMRLTWNLGDVPVGFTGSITIPVTIAADIPPNALTVSITAGADDAAERETGAMDLTNLDLIAGRLTSAAFLETGLRFSNVPIPAGATILSASIEFTPRSQSGIPLLQVSGQDALNPLSFTADPFDISNRPRTSAVVDWTVTGSQTPDIKDIVQELVNQGGWTPGNPMAFFLKDNGSAANESVRFASFERSATEPRLHITYEVIPGSDPTAGRTFINTSTISTDRQETDYTNNNDDVPVVVGTLANVGITKTGPATAPLGGTVAYTLNYYSNGNDPAADVVVTDTLPAGLSFAGASLTPDSVSGQTLTWNLGTLAPGASGTITVTASVVNNYLLLHNQTVVNLAQITTTTPEVNVTDNQDTHPVTLLGAPAVIGGIVWNDLDEDGIIDSGETGLDFPVLLTLTGTDIFGNPVNVTTETGPGGAYTFIGLNPSDATGYTITQTQPAGYASTADVLGTVSGTPVGTNANPLDDVLTNIVLASDDRGSNYNFGELRLGTISGFVRIDTTGDGAGDTPHSGVTVALLDENGDPVLDGEGQPITAVTDSTGAYTFEDLPAGDYQITQTVPSGYIAIDDSDGGPDYTLIGDPTPIALIPGQNLTNQNFTNSQPSSIAGTILLDINGDGLGDVGHPHIGVTVSLLDENGDPVLDSLGNPVTTVTDSNGDYSFTNLPGGQYQIAQSVPSGFTAVFDADGGDFTLIGDPVPITLVPDQNLADQDFANAQNGTIGDRVWLDENSNGLQDAGEDGIANVTVELVDAGNNVIATTVTDTEGNYLFNGVPPGTYTVRIDTTTLATGLAANPTFDEDGTGTPNASTLTLTAGQPYLTADFGYNWRPTNDVNNPDPGALGAIGDRLWIDADGNGLQDPGEPGLGGVTVELYYDSNGDGVVDSLYLAAVDQTGSTGTGTTTTNPDGSYVFTNLPAGTYVVVVNGGTTPAGYTQTGDPDATADNRTTTPVVLAPGDVFVNADFGYQPATTSSDITGIVYLDTNANANLDGIDTGVPGVSVALLDTNGNVIATTTTDATGGYTFPGLPAGDYTVWVNDTGNLLGTLNQTEDPDALIDDRHTVTVNGTDDVTNIDFGYTPNGHNTGGGLIGDLVFLDRDGDNLADPGEGLQGVTVQLFDATGTTLIATTVTNANGNYWFGGLPDADYVVKVVTATLPGGGTGLTNTVDPDTASPGDSESTVTITGGTIDLDQDFGYQALTSPNTIAGTIWDDTNADGTLNETATGIEGVTVTLRDSLGNTVATATTDADGNYAFTGLPDGTYTVAVTDTANLLTGQWQSTGPNPGADNNSQSDPYTVAVTGGETNSTADFGYYLTAGALGDFVWHDLNEDGIQDPGEPGIPGVAVQLTITWPDATTTVLTTVTNSSGYYEFGNLLLDENHNGASPGEPTYIISIPQLPGTTTLLGQGTAETDSDNPAGTNATVTQGATNDDLDFGFHDLLVHDISGTVLNDTINPGVLDNPGDTPVGGLLVTVYRDLDNDGQPDVNEPIGTTYTRPDGTYVFTDLPDGNYLLVINTPDGATNVDDVQGAPDDGLVAVTLTGADVANQDFLLGNLTTYAITGSVLQDLVNPGVIDNPGDTTLPGIPVELRDANGTLIATTTSDGSGNYSFPNLIPGDYQVTTVTPPGANHVTDADGNTNGPNLIETTVTTANVTGQDFLLDNVTATIAGNVLEDLNGLDDGLINGTGTNADTGTGGIYVNLVNPVDNTVIASIPVNPDGSYTFTATDGVEINSDYLLILTPDVQTVASVLTSSTLPQPWSSTGENLGAGPGSDGVVDGILAVSTTTGPLVEANFGVQSVPDLTPVITATPNIMNGPTDFTLRMRIAELHNVETNGPIVFRVPKDSRWTLREPYDNDLIELEGETMNNNMWAYSENADFHIFTSKENVIIAAGGASFVGIKARWESANQEGIYTISINIDSGSGSENRFDNNADAEKILFFND